jgi:hypothetical protein
MSSCLLADAKASTSSCSLPVFSNSTRTSDPSFAISAERSMQLRRKSRVSFLPANSRTLIYARIVSGRYASRRSVNSAISLSVIFTSSQKVPNECKLVSRILYIPFSAVRSHPSRSLGITEGHCFMASAKPLLKCFFSAKLFVLELISANKGDGQAATHSSIKVYKLLAVSILSRDVTKASKSR